MTVKLYTERNDLPAAFRKCALLYPFWGEEPPVGDDFIEPSRFAAYLRSAPDIFALSSLDQADAVLLPFNWEQIVDYAKNHPDLSREEVERAVQEATEIAQSLADRAAQASKPLLVFFIHDDESIGVPLHNALIFRPSLRGATRQPNEIALPGWRADFVESYCDGELPLRTKKDRPVVGYCGYSATPKRSWRGRTKNWIASSPTRERLASSAGIAIRMRPGERLRSQALHVLSGSRRVECNFLIRDSFWNGVLSRHTIDVPRAQQSRREYVDNMLHSDYILCARGMGNYSFRFYEALSCGRIPIFINTDCVLPCEDWVNWRECCVWVEEKDVPRLGSIVADFHARLSDQQFQDMQRECRQRWLRWLSPQGFFANLYRYLP